MCQGASRSAAAASKLHPAVHQLSMARLVCFIGDPVTATNPLQTEDVVKLALETWHKSHRAQQSEDVGITRLDIGETQYRNLEKIELELKESQRKEAFVEVDGSEIDLQTPRQCGPLAECRIRVYLREDDESGHFHLVGRRARDDGLVYTNSVLVRAVAV